MTCSSTPGYQQHCSPFPYFQRINGDDVRMKVLYIEVHPSLLAFVIALQCPKPILLQFCCASLSPGYGEGAISQRSTDSRSLFLWPVSTAVSFFFSYAPTHRLLDRDPSYVSCIVFITLQLTPSRASSPCELVAHTAPDSALTILVLKHVRNGPLGIFLTKTQANTTE